MGHGSGAVSATLHLTSGEWSDDLFHKAIIMSGTSFSAVRDAKSYKGAVDQVAATFGCLRKTSLLLQCLRRVDASILIENSPVMDWAPVVDNRLSNTTTPFIPDDPKLLLERFNAIQKVPIMIGFTDMEDVFDVSMREMLENGLSTEMYNTLITDVVLNDLAQLEANNETTCGENGGSSGNSQPVLDALEFVYKPYSISTNDGTQLRKKYIDFFLERSYIAPSFALARAVSRNSEVYMYRFDIKPKTQAIVDMLPTWSGVPQRFDQIFVWGMPYWISLENQTQWSSEDKRLLSQFNFCSIFVFVTLSLKNLFFVIFSNQFHRLSDIVMTMWANFAKFSNPTEFGVYIRWTNFSESDPGVLIIDRSFNMSDTTTLNYQGVQFWNDYYPKVIDFATQCCNVTNSANQHSIKFKSHHIVLTQFIVLVFFTFLISNFEAAMNLFRL